MGDALGSKAGFHSPESGEAVQEARGVGLVGRLFRQGAGDGKAGAATQGGEEAGEGTKSRGEGTNCKLKMNGNT